MRARVATVAPVTPARETAPPSQGLGVQTPADLRRLQRAIGNSGVRALLAPRRAIARYRLSPDAVMSAVERIPFMKGKLADAKVRGEAMSAQVKRQVEAYNAMFAGEHRGRTNTAVMLSTALNGVARVIAEELHDPGIQAKLAGHLFDLYQQEIKSETGLGGEGDKGGADALAMTKVLVSDDPLGLYMHNELRLETAAQRIDAMAKAMGRQPAETFELLRHKWEAEMAAHTKGGLEKAEPKGAYNIKESTGELSGAYFRKLFGTADAPQRKGSGGLVLAQEAEDRLGDLLKAVTTPAAAVDESAFAPRHAGMTKKQERHLSEIEQAEKPAVIQGARDQLAVYIAEAIGLGRAEADALTRTIETWLKTVPLTITVEGERWFAKGGPTSDDKAQFKPATETPKKTAQLADVFQKPGAAGSIDYAGKYDDAKHAAERGDNYLRFRRWKDDLMTGLLGMGASEMPAFGAANVNWDRMRGSIEHQVTKSGAVAGPGVGYYGDVHFLLGEAVRDRLVYTATDHGPPRREPLLALLDFLTGKNITGLLGKRNPTILYEVINAAKTKRLNIAAELPFEIQIFGGVDIRRDVRKILFAPSISGPVRMGIAIFCNVHPDVRQEEISSVGEASTVVAAGAPTIRDLQTAIRAELSKGGTSAKDVKKLEGLAGTRREYTVQALNLMRMDVSGAEDLALARKLAADVMEDSVEPTIRKAFVKYKAMLASMG